MAGKEQRAWEDFCGWTSKTNDGERSREAMSGFGGGWHTWSGAWGPWPLIKAGPRRCVAVATGDKILHSCSSTTTIAAAAALHDAPTPFQLRLTTPTQNYPETSWQPMSISNFPNFTNQSSICPAYVLFISPPLPAPPTGTSTHQYPLRYAGRLIGQVVERCKGVSVNRLADFTSPAATVVKPLEMGHSTPTRLLA